MMSNATEIEALRMEIVQLRADLMEATTQSQERLDGLAKEIAILRRPKGNKAPDHSRL